MSSGVALKLPLNPATDTEAGYAPVASDGSPVNKDRRGDTQARVATEVADVDCGGGNPCSPTAREVRIEYTDNGKPNDCDKDIQLEAPPTSSRRMVAGIFGVIALAVGAIFSTRTVLLKEAYGLRGGNQLYRKVSAANCADVGLLPITSVDSCISAAKALNLRDVTVSEVPSDAVVGLRSGGHVPRDCYYLTLPGADRPESLWFNSNSEHTLRRLTEEPAGVHREMLCKVAAANGTVNATRPRVQEHGSDSGGSFFPEPAGIKLPDALASLIYGTTSTTTTTTTTTTRTGTTSTVTTTTKTQTTTTLTATSTTRTTTSVTTTTTTFTTVYHEVPTLFCFSVVRRFSYELNNMRTALAKKTSIFDCNDFVVFSDQVYMLTPGIPVAGWGDLQFVSDVAPVQTVLLNHDLTTHPKPGSLEGILNTQIFKQAWKQINEDGRFRHYDWTVKIDPDAVFLPQRLISDLKNIAAPSDNPRLYIVNCKISFGLFGAIETFSRMALEKFIAGEQRCLQELNWQMMGEDLWMRRCFDLLGVDHSEDFNMLSDGYCSDEPSPCQSGKVAFHPFKSALSYYQCYNEAIATTTTSTSTSTFPTTSSKLSLDKNSSDNAVEVAFDREVPGKRLVEEQEPKPQHQLAIR